MAKGAQRIGVVMYKPDNTTNKDFSDQLLALTLKRRLNGIDYFEAILTGIDNDADKAYVDKNCTVAIYVGSRLVTNCIIDIPQYNADYTCKISGYESTGTLTSSVAGNTIRKLRRESTPSTMGNYSDTAVSTLLGSCCANVIAIDGTNNGGTNPISYTFYRENSLKEVVGLANQDGQSWWIKHTETGSAVTDTLHMASYKDVSLNSGIRHTSSQITYAISGSGQNTSNAKIIEESETECNHAIIFGSGTGLNQYISEVYEASGSYSLLPKALDTRLTVALDAVATSSTVNMITAHNIDNTAMSKIAVGTDFVVKLDDELIEVERVAGVSYLTILTRGFGSTTATAHKIGTDIIYWHNDHSGGATSVITFDVTATEGAKFASSTSIRIGSEILSTVSRSTDTLTAVRHVASTTNLVWYHGAGIYVFSYIEGGVTYTPYAPKAGSAIKVNGLCTKSYTETRALHPNELDRMAQNKAVRDKSNPVPRCLITPSDIFDSMDTNVNAPIDTGDKVTIDDTLGIWNMRTPSTGALITSSTYYINGFNLIYQYGIPTIEYELQNQRLAYSEELTEGIGVDYQKPTRDYAASISPYLKITSDGKVTLDSDYGDVELEAAGNIILDTALNGIIVRSGKYIRWLGPTNNGTISLDIYHNDANAYIVTNDGDLCLSPSIGAHNVIITDGSALVLNDDDNNAHMGISHTGTEGLIAVGAGHGNLQLTAGSTASTISIETSLGLNIYDPGDTKWISIYYDATDGHITTSSGALYLESNSGTTIINTAIQTSYDANHYLVFTNDVNYAYITSYHNVGAGALTGAQLLFTHATGRLTICTGYNTAVGADLVMRLADETSSYFQITHSTADHAVFTVQASSGDTRVYGTLTVDGCATDGTCEIMKDKNAINIIQDILSKGDNSFDEYGHEHMDMKYLHETYPFLVAKTDNGYGDKLGAKSDLLYVAVTQLNDRLKKLEEPK